MYIKKILHYLEKRKIIIFCLLSIACCNFAFAAVTTWQSLLPGLAYTQLYAIPGFPLGAIHAFKIDLKYFHLQMAFTENTVRPLLIVKDLVMSNNAVLGINGGFFSPGLEPIGLRIKDGQQVSPIKHISWWGVFYIKNDKPFIVSQKNFKTYNNISFAVESGPRLVINGRIPSLKPGLSFRSALGITANNNLIIAVTDRLPISTKTFAHILQTPEADGGLGCINALNLDGGSSSQIYAQIGFFNLDLPSLSPIADAVLVLPNS